MEVGEVFARTGRTIERLHVRLELNEITGYKASGESEVAEELNKEPGRIAARTARQLERLFRSLDTWFHPDHISDFALQALIKLNEKIRHSRFTPVKRG